MIIFLKNTLLFCGILLFFLFISFWLTIGINRKLYGNITIDENITTLIMGDSHTELAINDSLMKNTFNFSTPAEGYIFTYKKLRNILDNNKQIRNIFVGVSYHNLSSYYDKYIFEEEPYSLISQHISLLTYKELLLFLKETPSIQNLAAIFRNSLKNITKINKDKYPFNYGFHIVDNTDELTGERISKRINSQYYFENQILPTSDFNIFYLEKIVEVCKENGINLIFLNTPLYEGYYSRIPLNFINEYNIMVKNSGVIEVDFDGLELQSECFLPDGDHLRYCGAMLTTKFLVEYLRSKSDNAKFENKTGL